MSSVGFEGLVYVLSKVKETSSVEKRRYSVGQTSALQESHSVCDLGLLKTLDLC